MLCLSPGFAFCCSPSVLRGVCERQLCSRMEVCLVQACAHASHSENGVVGLAVQNFEFEFHCCPHNKILLLSDTMRASLACALLALLALLHTSAAEQPYPVSAANVRYVRVPRGPMEGCPPYLHFFSSPVASFAVTITACDVPPDRSISSAVRRPVVWEGPSGRCCQVHQERLWE